MKKVFFIIFIGILSASLNAQVGIGTTTPEGALDVSSSQGGL